MSRYKNAIILERRALTERICEFTLGLADGSPLPPFRAGAHVELSFGGQDGQFLRYYSLVGSLSKSSENEPTWRIAVQREDRARGSDYIHRTFKAGTEVKISQAMSPFRLSSDDQPVLLVAGGIGITAMLPMLRSCVMRNRDARMLYVGRRRDAMAYVDEVEALGGDAVTVHDEAAMGYRPDLDQLLAQQPPETTVYVCGPPPLIEGVSQAALRLGWSSDQVRHEIFNAAHKPEDHAVTVRTVSGLEVPVSPGSTLLEALESAGVETYSDCRRGECGLCITNVRNANGTIDHRDRFLTDEQKQRHQKIAICCSRPNDDLIELDI